MISVIVPVYNTSQYLERSIQALLDQDFPQSEYELIFVDNGSTDESLSILKQYPGIKVLSELERGAYAARNHGIQYAKGEVLAFTDPDCYPVSSWLSAIDEALCGDRVDVILGPRMAPTGNKSLQLISEYENLKASLVCKSGDPTVYFGYTNNMAVRRTTMDRFGPFEHRTRGADTIFVQLVIHGSSCDSVHYCPQMSVQHAELDSVRSYYAKMNIYGRSRQSYCHVVKVRPLSLVERLRTFAGVARKNNLIDSSQLFVLLTGGMLAWWSGSLKRQVADVCPPIEPRNTRSVSHLRVRTFGDSHK